MEGDDLDSINAALSKVSYINSRQFPTPGIRRLRIATSVQCFGEDSCISIPDVEAVVMVLPPSEPRITIAGAELLTRPAPDLRDPAGVALFQDLRIVSTVSKSDAAAHSAAHRPGVIELLHNLDYCDVLVIGEELDPEQESLHIPRSALQGKHLDATNSTSGISIYGVDSMSHYEEAIRQVRYRNWHPAGLRERRFCVTCSELNGRYTSNEFNMEVSVLHRSEAVDHVNHMAAQSQYMRAVHHPVMVHSLNSAHSTGTPPVATVVIVMCIAALVVIVVLGIYRIHAAHQLGSKSEEGDTEHRDADWDESALTITVNPMENVEEPKAADEEASEEEEEDEEDEEEEDDGLEDDVTSMESEDSDDEEAGVHRGTEGGKSKGRLEWNTTLS